jgi:hypothetical protein
VWGIPIRVGYDEIDDPHYHRGLTGHAYLVGNDRVAICGYRPSRRGLLSRRPARLGFPSDRLNPACDMCASRIAPPSVPSTTERTVRSTHAATPARPFVPVPVVRPPSAPARPLPPAQHGPYWLGG